MQSSRAIIWFDLNFNNQENERTAEAIRRQLDVEVVGDATGSFTRLDHLLRDHETILIVSGRLKQELVDYVRERRLHPWVRVIVYCSDKSRHEDAYEHSFVAEVVDNFGKLEEVLSRLLHKQAHQHAGSTVLEVAVNERPKKLRTIEVQMLQGCPLSYMSQLELVMASEVLTLYRQVRKQHHAASDHKALVLGYGPLGQFTRFKTAVHKQLITLFGGESANCLIPPLVKGAVESATTFWKLCRALLVLLTSSYEIVCLVGRVLFPPYEVIDKQYPELYLAIFSNFLFLEDTRHIQPTKKMLTNRNWSQLPIHSIVQSSNFLVFTPPTGKERGDITINIQLGEHIASTNLFAPYVVLDNGKTVYAPYSRFIIRSVDQSSSGTTLTVAEVWDRCIAERICLQNLLLPSSSELLLEMVKQAHTRQDRLPTVWMFRYYIDRYLAGNRTQQQLLTHIQTFLADPRNSPGTLEIASLKLVFEEVTKTKLQIQLPEPPIHLAGSRAHAQLLIQAAKREYNLHNEKLALELAHRYLKLTASNDQRCSYQNNLMANFIQCMVGNCTPSQAEQLLQATNKLIGSSNYIAATLCQKLGSDHLDHHRIKPAEQYFLRSVSLWQQTGITRHKSLSLSLQCLAFIHRQRGMDVEARMFLRKARTSQP